jgi:hypothetical protein
MGTEPVPETLYLNQLTRLIAREDYIELHILLHLDASVFTSVKVYTTILRQWCHMPDITEDESSLLSKRYVCVIGDNGNSPKHIRDISHFFGWSPLVVTSIAVCDMIVMD